MQITFNLQSPDGTEYFLAEEPTLLLVNTPTKVVNNMFQIADYSISLCHPTFPITRAFGEMMETVANHMWLPELSDVKRSRVIQAVCYLDKHVAENISVARLAKMCMMNENQFRFEFKNDIGKTPVQYKQENKIKKPKNSYRLPQIFPRSGWLIHLAFLTVLIFTKPSAK